MKTAQDNRPSSYRCKTIAILAILFSFIVVASLTLSTLGTQDPDDYTIGLMLCSFWPNQNLSLFIGAPLSYFILFLNNIFPLLNWYYIIERVFVFISLAFITYASVVFVPRGNPLTSLGALIVLILLISGTLINSNFTFVAAFLTISGEYGLLLNVLSKKMGQLSKGIAVALFYLGFLYRPTAWLLTIPFFILALFITCFLLRGTLTFRQSVIAHLRSSQSYPILTACLICVVSFLVSQVAIHNSPGIAYWDRYNLVHSALFDYPLPAYSEIASQLQGIDVSENDYILMRKGMTFDSSVFTLEKMMQTLAIAQDGNALPGNAFFNYLSIEHFFSNPILVVVISATVLIALIVCPRKITLAILASFIALALACCTYFTWIGRLPLRVENTIWASTLSSLLLACSCVPLSPRFRTENLLIVLNKVLLAAILLAQLILATRGFTNFQGLSSILPQKDSRTELAEQMEHNEGGMFLWDPYATHFFRTTLDYRHLPSAHAIRSNVNTFGWVLGSPQLDSTKSELGILDDFTRFYTEGNYLYITAADRGSESLILTFIHEHYNENVVFEEVETIASSPTNIELKLLRFSD